MLIRKREFDVRFQKVNGLVVTWAVCLFCVSPAQAHHAAPAFFDVQATVSVEGTVTAHRLSNPHSYFRVTTDDGVDWAFESGPSWTALAKAGWDESTVPEGARVRMTGNPALNGRPIARYQTIMVHAGEGGEPVMIFGGGRAPWVARATELGGACNNGVEACVSLDTTAIETLQAEFGDNGVWSARSAADAASSLRRRAR